MQKFLYGQENSKIIIFFNIHFIIFGYYNEDYKLKSINLMITKYFYITLALPCEEVLL